MKYSDAKLNDSTPGEDGDDEANEHEIYSSPYPFFAASEQIAVLQSTARAPIRSYKFMPLKEAEEKTGEQHHKFTKHSRAASARTEVVAL